MVAADGAGDYVCVRGGVRVECLAEEPGYGRACLDTELSLVSPALESFYASTARGGSLVIRRSRHCR
jgi:hypothetical protein